MKVFDIPNIDGSIKRDYYLGLITLKESAIEWHKLGAT